MKSVSYVDEPYHNVYLALCDLELKKKYDESYDGGKYVYVDLPYDGSFQYTKFKKVLVVSARDMVIIGKAHRVSESEMYLMAKSTSVPSIPENKGIVRAETPISGWRIKQIDAGDAASGRKPRCKLWFYTEADFKISLFLQKSAGPKTGHLAMLFADYIRKHPLT